MKKSTRIVALTASALLLLSVIGCKPISEENKTADGASVAEKKEDTKEPVKDETDPSAEDSKGYPVIKGLDVINVSGNFIVQWSPNTCDKKYALAVCAVCLDPEFEKKEADFVQILPAAYDDKNAVYYDTGVFALNGLAENGRYVFVVFVLNANGEIESKGTYSNTLIASKDSLNPSVIQTIDYNEINGQSSFDVKKGVKFLIVNNVEGKNVSFANVNPTNDLIPAEATTSATFVLNPVNAKLSNTKISYDELESGEKSADVKSILMSSKSSFIKNTDEYEWDIIDAKIPGTKEFVPPANDAKVIAINDAPSSRYAVEGHEDKIDLDNLTTNGTTYRYLWLDNDENNETFRHKRVTLRAIGKNDDGIKCLVWVCDENYTDGESKGMMVNTAVAEHIANVFTARCDDEREIYGNEYDNLFVEDFEKDLEDEISMDDGSKTKKLVNIIIYDIGNDYDKTGGSILGYFWAKDYFAETSKNYFQKFGLSQVYDMSNAGKFFYIDAPFCNYVGVNEETQTYDFSGCANGQKCSGQILSTLLHEFQHMIHFGMKGVTEYASETWFNEMCSMLAEDMFQDELGIPDSDSPQSRLAGFNLNNHYSGITDWRRDGSVTISYASAYAFGAFLVRNFGGVDLVKELLRNEAKDMDSVVAAVSKVSGKEFTQESLLKAYLEACAFKTDYAVKNNLLYSFFKDGKGYTSKDGAKLTFKKINLYSEFNSYHSYNPEFCYGPRRHNATEPTYLRPVNFVLHDLGNYNEDNNSCIVLFNVPAEQKDEIVVMVQDEFDIFTPSELK